MTVMIFVLTLCYAAVKFVDLYKRNDPNIRENFIPNSFGEDDYLSFADDLNFRMAVGIRKPGEKKLIKYDPQIGRWLARIHKKDD